MKVRTSLAAAATAAAVTVSGVTAAGAVTVNDTPESKAQETTKKKSGGSSFSDISEMSIDEINDWIAVVTAIVGLITQVLTVVNKFAR